MRRSTCVLAGVLALVGLVGCSSENSPEPQPATAASVAATPGADALRRSAEQLDRLASKRDDAGAWDYYSQRCKAKVGSLASYSAVLDLHYSGRTPNYTDWKVTVDGSHGEVVTIDSDPSAPPSSFAPRTWTLIDNRWQFDNC